MKLAVLVFALCCIACALAETKVSSCPQGKSLEEFKQTVSVGRCKKPPCRLKKGRHIEVGIKFTADRKVEKLTHTVNALLAGLPFPFIGVDGTDACPNIYETDATTKAGCPLEAGKEYIYKNTIEVLEIYPNLRLVVHWALTGGDGKDVACFHTPARISN